MKTIVQFISGLIPIIILFFLLTLYMNHIDTLPKGYDTAGELFVFLLFLYLGGSFFICFITGIFAMKLSKNKSIFILIIYLIIFTSLTYCFLRNVMELSVDMPALFAEFVCGFIFGCLFSMMRKVKKNGRH